MRNGGSAGERLPFLWRVRRALLLLRRRPSCRHRHRGGGSGARRLILLRDLMEPIRELALRDGAAQTAWDVFYPLHLAHLLHLLPLLHPLHLLKGVARGLEELVLAALDLERLLERQHVAALLGRPACGGCARRM